MKRTIVFLALLSLAACSDYEPVKKEFKVDPVTHRVTLPSPCPDWSQVHPGNYDNSRDSNFGCATENNIAVQLADPGDAIKGHGEGSDTQASTRAIQRYRAGEIPVPLQPVNDIGGN